MTTETIRSLDSKRRRTKDRTEAMQLCVLVAQIKAVMVDGNNAVVPFLARHLAVMDGSYTPPTA